VLPARADEVPAEAIQAGGNTLRFDIHKLINSIWNEGDLSAVKGICFVSIHNVL
jgi:hypothetical protein